MDGADPLTLLSRWLDEAGAAGYPDPPVVAFVTASADARPSARMVGLKRVEHDALIITTALWTRKAREFAANPNVSLLFHWPSLGRQAHIAGEAEIAERALAEDLFAERGRLNQLQALVSRQGEPIASLAPLRDRLADLKRQFADDPIPCPPDWGAVRIRPNAIELWQESTDRLHDRALYERIDRSWRCTRLAP